jgi:hypothetical protein
VRAESCRLAAAVMLLLCFAFALLHREQTVATATMGYKYEQKLLTT